MQNKIVCTGDWFQQELLNNTRRLKMYIASTLIAIEEKLYKMISISSATANKTLYAIKNDSLLKLFMVQMNKNHHTIGDELNSMSAK
jgi:hypothetical protein